MEILVLFLVMLALVAAQSIVYKKLSFKGLRYHCEFNTDEVFEGTEIFLTETVENQKWLPLPWFKSEITTSKWLDFAGAQSVVTYHTRFVPSFFLVKGHKKVTRRWNVVCIRRGVFSIENVMLVSTDLLGSRTVSRPAPAGASVTVLPKPLPLIGGIPCAFSAGTGPVSSFRRTGISAFRPDEKYPLERHGENGADHDTEPGVYHKTKRHGTA